MGRKIIYLVRHGQSKLGDSSSDGLGESLTDLGKRQAHLVAQRLRQFPIDCIHYSSLRRSAETAAAIAVELSDIPCYPSEALWEFSWKIFTDETGFLIGEAREQAKAQKDRIEAAFEQHFTPSSTKADQHEVLVCHGNIIRYFICCTLDIPPETLLNMESSHCGLSTVSVEPNGRKLLIAYNDVGHLPISAQTYLLHVPIERISPTSP